MCVYMCICVYVYVYIYLYFCITIPNCIHLIGPCLFVCSINKINQWLSITRVAIIEPTLRVFTKGVNT